MTDTLTCVSLPGNPQACPTFPNTCTTSVTFHVVCLVYCCSLTWEKQLVSQFSVVSVELWLKKSLHPPSHTKPHPENEYENLTTAGVKKINWIYQNKFKQGALVHFEELLVPYRNVICPLLLVFIVLRRWGVIFVMSAPLNHLRGKHKRNNVNKIIDWIVWWQIYCQKNHQNHKMSHYIPRHVKISDIHQHCFLQTGAQGFSDHVKPVVLVQWSAVCPLYFWLSFFLVKTNNFNTHENLIFESDLPLNIITFLKIRVGCISTITQYNKLHSPKHDHNNNTAEQLLYIRRMLVILCACMCFLYLLKDSSVHIRKWNWIIVSFVIHSQICQIICHS